MSTDSDVAASSSKDKTVELMRGLSIASQPIETAMEAREPPPPDVVKLCRETFQNTADYLKGELEATAEDYKLLEEMNKVTVTKYEEMKHIAINISKSLHVMNEKYKLLQPYLDQIDQIEESVASLEQAAYRLDAYSKRLEARFKQLEKR
ncbi:biogenesis of lysosome-related organelles complex 1 subunit 2-like [Liolophura sinensis]|uniref:biogenesis of lysosome-related organelles complex 1 subunit 2-like n=1 Tax=Liolophura sinensis TaxID=3198878 RepID=UPI0031598CBD